MVIAKLALGYVVKEVKLLSIPTYFEPGLLHVLFCFAWVEEILIRCHRFGQVVCPTSLACVFCDRRTKSFSPQPLPYCSYSLCK